MKKFFSYFIPFATLAIFAQSCANMASGPTGGLKDSIPPVCLESNPKYGAVNVKGNKVSLYFDEYITLSNPSKNVIVSPTQDVPPVVKGVGRKVSVEFKDSLLPNTTYTIDFGKSIVDNNESNPLGDYSFCFSTGSSLDSMSISGTVLNAQTLQPVKEAYVGVYSNLSDTIFSKEKMERVAMTDADGKFTMRNLAAKSYRLYALTDANNNRYFDLPTEALAFQKETIVPAMSERAVVDTFYNDSMQISRIENRVERRFYPDSIVLLMFNEEVKQQLFVKQDRPMPDKVVLYFKNYNKLMPELKPLNFKAEDWAVVEPSVTMDTITYWVKDTVLAKMDTLLYAMNYQKYDSAGVLVPALDTLPLAFFDKTKKSRRRKKAEEKQFLEVENFTSVLEWNADAVLYWSRPVVSFGKEQIKLQEKQDSLWNDINVTVEPKAGSGNRGFVIKANVDPEKRYRMIIDSASVTSINGLHNDSISWPLRRRSDDDYVKLVVHTKNAPANAIAEATVRNNVKYSVKLNEKGDAVFEKITPSDYVIRLYEDRNGDGKWTTGKFDEQRLPEPVYYFNKTISLKAGWDQEEDWDVTELPLPQQAPKKAKKSK